MKIYIVTRGEYDDFEILGASIDRERAEKIAEMFGTSCYGDEPEIITFEDGYAQNLCCDGDCEYLYSVVLNCDKYGAPNFVDVVRIEYVPNDVYKNRPIAQHKVGDRFAYFTYVIAKSSDIAILIAKDKVCRYIQKGKTEVT